MNKQSPLHVSASLHVPVNNGNISNKRGRPTMKNIIKFGPQPKSIIAQKIMNEMKTKILSEGNEDIISLDDYSDDSAVAYKSEDHTCPMCSLRLDTRAEYEEHLAKHKQFSCDFPNCSYSCKFSSNLIKHKRVHTNEKPYLCEKCCFRSNFVNSLKAHKRTHTTERPYQCSHCSYKCNSSSNLKKHCRHRHPDIFNCICVKT